MMIDARWICKLKRQELKDQGDDPEAPVRENRDSRGVGIQDNRVSIGSYHDYPPELKWEKSCGGLRRYGA
jgi:hypothetical protein